MEHPARRAGASGQLSRRMLPNRSDLTSKNDTQPILKKPVASVRQLPEPWLDSDEAASIMKIHPKTLQKLARRGIVRGVHIGKLWRFRASEIEEWIHSQLAS